ncbi:MAG: type II toxin-antitoxin system RelE/ParE family toxin [Pseudomonadales bacterium]|nr:type II toxin-antitoxin system RelE/ParE family toxin [Pseudomonadales bacterium]
MHYKLSLNAEADLDRIFDFGIDTFGLNQAIKYKDQLQSRFEELAENPFLFPAIDDIREGYRRSVCGVHAIYYKANNDTVEIMRLINREDLKKALNLE